jgi:hypothetical protein
MGYINSVPYVQRQIDLNLEEFREFCRAYVDDLVIASEDLDEHLIHLELVFQRLEDMNVKLEPTKVYIGFPSVKLLGQRVDAFGLSTPEERIAAIQKIAFPKTLRELEIYLGLTSWFRHYVEKYAEHAAPLERRKTALLKGGPIEGRARRQYALTTAMLDPTEAEIQAFQHLQKAFSKPLFLTHFDPTKHLYLDIDASRILFGVMVFHTKLDFDHGSIKNPLSKPPPRTQV